MTELARIEPDQTATVYTTTQADPTGGRLVAWADGLAAAHRIGSALCTTAFAPAHFRGKPDDAAAAILYGDEIGLSPTQALRSIFMVSGTPGMYARQMVALVLSRGHQVWTVEKSDSKVTVAGQRRGSPHVIEETWTTARATKAGYTSNKKYQTDPASMLYARAAADVCRQVAPDALAGLAVTVEELEVNGAPVTTTRRAVEPATTRQRAITPPAAAGAAPEPDLEPPLTEAAPEPEPTITKAQQVKLHASLHDAGKGDRDAGLAYISDVLDREVDSTKTLTKGEASKVIDALTRLLEPQPAAQDTPPAEPPEEPWT